MGVREAGKAATPIRRIYSILIIFIISHYHNGNMNITFYANQGRFYIGFRSGLRRLRL
jgi:hypothetical protein